MKMSFVLRIFPYRGSQKLIFDRNKITGRSKLLLVRNKTFSRFQEKVFISTHFAGYVPSARSM